MTGFWGFVYMPGGHLFVGQVAILAVTCVVAYCYLRTLFTELPRRGLLGNSVAGSSHFRILD
jgi:hypothetical protein